MISKGEENNGSTPSQNDGHLQQKGNKTKTTATAAASLKAFRNIYEDSSSDLHASGSLALKEFRQAYQNGGSNGGGGGDGGCGQTTTSESSLSLTQNNNNNNNNNGQQQEKDANEACEQLVARRHPFRICKDLA